MSARAAARHPSPAPGEPVNLPRTGFSATWLQQQLRALIGSTRGRSLCVAYSGGLDSASLLAALAAARARAGFRLRAVHVDHGLHPQSAHWAALACAQAKRARVRCDAIRVRVARNGASLEAAARAARYAALARALSPGELLLTAHTQDDQLETILLALLRGSGVRGLAAMGGVSQFGDTQLVRPLLNVSRLQLEQYAHRRALAITPDPSNEDERMDRNYLRLRVVPLLRERWPAAAVTAGRSARHLAEAQGLLERAARAVLATAADGAALRVSALRALSLVERRNALRYWIQARGLPTPDHRRLREIAGPMLTARADACPSVRWPGGELRRHGERLVARTVDAAAAPPSELAWDWRVGPQLALPQGGVIALLPDAQGEIALNALPCPLRVAYRRGGERLAQPGGHLALKDLLQQRGIEPWLRAAVPLLASGERILAVSDVWLDNAIRAHAPGSDGPRARLRWRRPMGDGD